MILFFADGECESDDYADIVNAAGGSLPGSVGIVREEGKKPRFDCDEVHFSLSHSHGVIMLGISRTEIGVDIEMIRPVSESLLRLVASPRTRTSSTSSLSRAMRRACARRDKVSEPSSSTLRRWRAGTRAKPTKSGFDAHGRAVNLAL